MKNSSTLNLYEFHKIMEENNIALIYDGDFSQEFTKSILAFMEKKFISDEVEDIIRRKIFNIMVELLQNLSKHNYNDQDRGLAITSTFMIGYNENDYMIVSGNPILNENIESLKSKIDQVNGLDKDGLKDLYKKVRLQGRFSEVGGAGIGLIDMARKSGNQLDYNFKEIEEGLSFFTMAVYISKEQ